MQDNGLEKNTRCQTFHASNLSYPIFMPKLSSHRVYAQDQLFHTYGQKFLTDNQMSQIKYNYYIDNVSKDYDDSEWNETMEDSKTP
jgi:hypothetical protein